MTTAQDQQSRAVIAAWNAQADEHNQWETLGDDEKIDWAIQAARALPAGMEPELFAINNAPEGFNPHYEQVGDEFRDGPDVVSFFSAAQVQAMGRVPPGWQAVPAEADAAIIEALAGPGRVLPAYVGAKEKSDARLAEKWSAALAAAPRPPTAQEQIPSNSAGLRRKPLDRIAVLFKIDAVLCKEKNPLQAAEEICAIANRDLTHPTGD